MPGGTPLDSDLNGPDHACICLNPQGDWPGDDRPCRHFPLWAFECPCGHKWIQNRAASHTPLETCRACYPCGMRRFLSYSRTEEHFLDGMLVSEEVSRPRSEDPATVGFEGTISGPSREHTDIRDVQDTVITSWQTVPAVSEHSSSLPACSCESSSPLRRSPAPNLMDIDIPSYRLSGFISQFDPEDSDDDMQETR